MVDTEPAPGSTAILSSGRSVSTPQLNLETAVLRIVEQDPFASIGEITTEINHRPGNLRASWWQVFSFLRKRRLLTRRSRFKYILGRR